MGYSFKALIEHEKSVGQPLGQLRDRRDNSCPKTNSALGQENNVVPLFSDEVEERIGIVEYDGKIPRPWAICYALLLTAPRPDWLGADQWQEHLSAAGNLLACWAGQMERLGWSPKEVLGIDARSPANPWEPSSLLSALVGVTVGAMSRDRVSIIFPDSGSRCLERNNGKWTYA